MLAINSDKEVQDAALGYIEKHNLAPLLREVMEACLMTRPTATIPFMMDCFELGPGNAVQDKELGIAVWRRKELETLYGTIVQHEAQEDQQNMQGQGVIDRHALKDYVTKGSMQLMTDEDVGSWIACLGDEPSEGDTPTVTLQQFLQVFAAMTRNVDDECFRHMIVDLSC